MHRYRFLSWIRQGNHLRSCCLQEDSRSQEPAICKLRQSWSTWNWKVQWWMPDQNRICGGVRLRPSIHLTAKGNGKKFGHDGATYVHLVDRHVWWIVYANILVLGQFVSPVKHFVSWDAIWRAKRRNHIQPGFIVKLIDVVDNSAIVTERQDQCRHVAEIESKTKKFANVGVLQLLPVAGVLFQALCKQIIRIGTVKQQQSCLYTRSSIPRALLAPHSPSWTQGKILDYSRSSHGWPSLQPCSPTTVMNQVPRKRFAIPTFCADIFPSHKSACSPIAM